jgi:hypothetical protein
MRKHREITYSITNTGCWECTSHAPDGWGYPHFQKNKKTIIISRFMYEKNIGPIPEGMVIRHKCDNTMCINPDHLEIGTQKDNMNDMVIRGRSLKGSKHNLSKLTEENVVDILRRVNNGECQAKLAREFKVSYSRISMIANGHEWKHVGGIQNG